MIFYNIYIKCCRDGDWYFTDEEDNINEQKVTQYFYPWRTTNVWPWLFSTVSTRRGPSSCNWAFAQYATWKKHWKSLERMLSVWSSLSLHASTLLLTLETFLLMEESSYFVVCHFGRLCGVFTALLLFDAAFYSVENVFKLTLI